MNTLTRMPAPRRPAIVRAAARPGLLGRPAPLARDLARQHRHERALIGPHLVHQRHQIGPRVALDVELECRGPRGRSATGVAISSAPRCRARRAA